MTTEILRLFKETTAEYIRLLSSFSQEQVNTLPFEGSWTAGQVADHINKSNAAMLQSFGASGKKAERNIEERVEALKSSMANFEEKFKSPEFILPVKDFYIKEELLAEFNMLTAQLRNVPHTLDLTEIIRHPVLGEISKFEMFHFLVYHTKRHIHQLENISSVLFDQISVHQVQ